MKSTRQKILLFTLLSLTTLCISTFIIQYQDVKRQLLSNADFSEKLSQWKSYKAVDTPITINNNELFLSSPATDRSVRTYQTVTTPMGGKKVRLRALLRTKEVVAGEKPWNKARLLLVQYFDGKARYSLPHTVVALEGTNEWQDVSKIFTIAANCSEFRVIVQMSHCSGEFFLKELSLYQVEERTLYRWVKWLVRGAWIFFIFFLFVPYLKNSRFGISKSLVYLLVAVIVIGTAMPAAVKKDLEKTIDSELIGKVQGTRYKVQEIIAHISSVKHHFPRPDWLQSDIKKIDVTKIAHFVLFALLVLILRKNTPDRPVSLVMLDILMLACATELNQFLIENRSPLFTDVVIDIAGGGAGLFLARLFSSLKD